MTAAERQLADRGCCPDEPAVAAHWAVAVMELGALVCTATQPRVRPAARSLDRCAWLAAGRPAHDGPARKVQTYAGTDRQCRGRLLAVLRDTDGQRRPKAALDPAWADGPQRERALASLVADGLVVALPDDRFALP